MRSPVKVTTVLTARPGRGKQLADLLASMAPHCRAEAGNVRWDVWQDQANADRYVLDELYLSDADVTAHRETPHYRYYLAMTADLADRTAVVSSPFLVA